MENTHFSNNSTFCLDSEQVCRFVGYVNPQRLRPSFIIPIFGNGEGINLMQRASADEKIIGFIPYDRDSVGDIISLSRRISVRIGDPAIHGFVLRNGNILLEARNQMMTELAIHKKSFASDHFLYLEVLHYLEDDEAIFKELQIIRNVYADNPMIGVNFVNSEKQRLLEKKTHEIKPQPKVFDKHGYLNYWDLQKNLPDLFADYGQTFIKLKLARSFAGKSPLIKNVLRGIGFHSKKIDSETRFVAFNKSKWKSLKDIINSTSVIVEVRYYQNENDVTSIKAIDPCRIRTRYIKKDKAKIVKNSNSKDYIFSTMNIDNRNFSIRNTVIE